MNRKVVSVKQAAFELGVAEVTIRTWLSKRYMACTRLGRAVRIPVAEIDRIIADGCSPARRSRDN